MLQVYTFAVTLRFVTEHSCCWVSYSLSCNWLMCELWTPVDAGGQTGRRICYKTIELCITSHANVQWNRW